MRRLLAGLVLVPTALAMGLSPRVSMENIPNLSSQGQVKIRLFWKKFQKLKPEDWLGHQQLQADLAKGLALEDRLAIASAFVEGFSEDALLSVTTQGDLEPRILHTLAQLAQRNDCPEALAFRAAGRLTGMGPRKGKVALPEAELRSTFEQVQVHPKCHFIAVMGMASLGFTPADAPTLKRFLQDPDPSVRKGTLEALSLIPEPWTTPYLTEGLADSHGDAQMLCARALDQRDAREALPALIRVLERALEKDAFLYDQAAPCCAAGKAIVRMAGLQGQDLSFEQRVESFHVEGIGGGLRQLDQRQEFREATRKVLAWWKESGAHQSSSPR